MQQFINHNGKILPADQPSLSHENRAFRYGDALFETIRIVRGKPLFLEDHVARLISGIKLMRMDVPANLHASFLHLLIDDLIKRNAVASDARARFTVYRNKGGFYAPDDNRVSFLLEMEALEGQGYSLNETGLSVDVFQEQRKAAGNKLSSIKSANSAIYVIAGAYKVQQGLDDVLLINTNMNVIESVNSNVFAVKNNVLYTAPLSEGCVDGVMRRQVIRLAEENRVMIYEVPIPQSVLINSDELFLTNTIKGIQWVRTYKGKHYTNTTVRLFVKMLNEKYG